MTAQDILKMIEEVDPTDTAKLYEIDARVWCLRDSVEYQGKVGEKHFFNNGFGKTLPCGDFEEPWHIVPKYTRSRDALKDIRPEGFKTWVFFDGYREGAKYRAEMFTPEMLDEAKKNLKQDGHIIQTDWLPTEELAELHAIIQAIEYERKRK